MECGVAGHPVLVLLPKAGQNVDVDATQMLGKLAFCKDFRFERGSKVPYKNEVHALYILHIVALPSLALSVYNKMSRDSNVG